MTPQPTSNIDPTKGGGPWTLRPLEKIGGSMDSGDVVAYHLREYEFNGRKGYFVPWLPLSNITVTNKSSGSEVLLTTNGTQDLYVPPNSERGITDTNIRSIRLENVGSTAISGSDLRVAVSKDAYDADEAALDSKQEPTAQKLLKGLIGL